MYIVGSISPNFAFRYTTLVSLLLGGNNFTSKYCSVNYCLCFVAFLISCFFLSGTIPDALGVLTNLQALSLHDNSLQGIVRCPAEA